MNFSKVIWVLRAIIYSFFTKFKFPGYIGKPTYIKGLKRIKFGKKVRIYPGLRAEVVDKNGEIEIGNNVSIGQNFHVISNDEKLKIGDNTVISGNVFISNCDHEYKDVNKYLFEQPLKTKTTEIGENCFIGYGAVIQAGTVLGRNCIVGSNAVLKGEYPSYSVIVGVPGKVKKYYDFEEKKWKKVENGE